MVKYYKDLFNPKVAEIQQGSYITIGTFDGVHKGHQQLISDVVREAKKNSSPSIVITFDPLPKTFFGNADTQSIRLTCPTTRAERIAALGVDILLEYTFDHSFSKISANDFIKKILLGLNPKRLFIGEDFRFGYKGSGNPDVLKREGLRYGFETQIVKFMDLYNERISSTSVRHAIKNGDLKFVTELLGKKHEMSGRIARTLDDYEVLFLPDYDIILPPAGEYMVSIENSSKKYFTKATILAQNKSTLIILEIPMINSLSKDNVILKFIQSNAIKTTEEMKSLSLLS